MLKSRNSAFFSAGTKLSGLLASIAGPVWLSFEFFPEVVESPAPGKRAKHFQDWERSRKHIPGFYASHQLRKGTLKNAANAQHNSTGDQRLAGATYIGNELLWL